MDVGLPISGKDSMSAQSCICLFSSLYPPSMGGVEVYTASIARELCRMGLNVIVVTCALNEDEGVSVEDGIEILRLPCRPLLGGRYPIPRHNAAARSWWRWLEEKPIDFIEVQTRFYPLSAEALAFAERKGVVPIVLEHGSAHLTMGNAIIDKAVQAVEHSMTMRCLKHPAAFYGVSSKASNWLTHFGIDSHGELPNAIDVDSYVAQASSRDFRKELHVGEDSFMVAFVGRLVPEKGIIQLAKASKLLKNSNVSVVIGGDGPLLDSLKAYESPSFKLLGKLSRTEVAALLKQSDAMCLPSRSEGFATVLLEAAVCGAALISTDVGGARELIPDSTFGTILADNEPQTIASAILAMSINKESLTKMRMKSSARVRSDYSWNRTARATLRAFASEQL